MWRQIDVESTAQGYDHNKRWDSMRDFKDIIKITEDKMIVKEDYNTYHRTKFTTLEKWKHQSYAIQKNHSLESPKITSVYFNNVEMNGV